MQTVSLSLGGANAALSPLPPHRMSILKQRSWSCGTLQNRLFLFGKRASRSSCGARPVSWVARRSNLIPRSCSSIMVKHPWFWLCKRASLSLSRAMRVSESSSRRFAASCLMYQNAPKLMVFDWQTSLQEPMRCQGRSRVSRESISSTGPWCFKTLRILFIFLNKRLPG